MANQTIKFYDMKAKHPVEIPAKDCVKTKHVNGNRTTYAVTGTSKTGTKLHKFVKEADWKALDCKEGQ